jgi:hypothetical protein
MDKAVTWTKPGNPVDLLMRSLLLAQAPYQMPQATGAFARQIDVLGRIEPKSKLYKSITEALGMAPLTYLQIAVFFWCSQEQGMQNVFTPVYMQSLKKAFGDKAVECFLKTIAFPQELVASQLGPVSEDEWFQPTPLYRTPYVDYGNQRFNWGRPNIQRHLEFAFSDIISHEQDTVRQAFENAFEQYVGDSLRRTGLQTFNEDEIKKRFKLDGLCNDFAIIDSDVVVLFEAKNKALTHTLPASASAMTYQSKFKATVVKAAAQIDNVAKRVKADGAFSHANIHLKRSQSTRVIRERRATRSRSGWTVSPRSIACSKPFLSLTGRPAFRFSSQPFRLTCSLSHLTTSLICTGPGDGNGSSAATYDARSAAVCVFQGTCATGSLQQRSHDETPRRQQQPS